MSFLTDLRRVRLEQVMTQQMLEVKVGVSQANWSKYENGDIDMPEDVAMKTLMILGDARLKAIYQHEKRIGVFNTPLLTEIDENPYTVLNVVVEESLEMIRSAETLKRLIRNKKRASDFTDAQWAEIMVCEEQICDVMIAVETHLIRMSEVYGLDLKRLELRMLAKFRDKKYI